ncbi:MAG: hypothetical protein AAGM22_00365 [Acidobacteriota bacterium]
MTRCALRISLTLLAAARLAPATTRAQDGAAPAAPDAVAGPDAEARPDLEFKTVPAAGAQRSRVTVPSFGRYALFAESDRGVSLQLVDRMAGPGPVVGEAGVEDGRVDAFLDRGDYLVRTLGHPEASGDATLHAVPFRELQPEPLQLVDLKPAATELGDLEQRSWWIRVRRSKRIILEAAGRHLEDLRLWRNGAWLVAASPDFEVIEPRPGQPLRLARLSVQLDAGLYRITAYGGVGVPWTEDPGGAGGAAGAGESSRPLYLRSGVPKVTSVARRRFEISPFGFDRLRVPGPANYFRVDAGAEGPAGDSIDLELGQWWDEERPFAVDSVQSASITKDNRGLYAELEVFTSEEEERWHLVTVRGRAGESVLLQHFRAADSVTFDASGRYLLSTVSTGDPADSVDVSALLVRRNRSRRGVPPQVERARSVSLERGLEWRRRFNLPSTTTLFLHVKDAGRYAVRGGDGQGRGAVRVRVEPFFVPGSEPKGYERPPFREDGDVYDLNRGFFRLTLEPGRQGILTLAIRDERAPESSGEVTHGETGHTAPVQRAMAFFGPVEFDGSDYTLYLNRRPGVRAGVIRRQLPIDLDRSLPLVADRRGLITVPARSKQPGLLRATAEDGTLLEVSIDGGPWRREVRVAGLFEVAVRPPSELVLPTTYDLAVVPDQRSPDVAPPPVSAEELKVPEFPSLEAGAPRREEITRRGLRTFLVRSDEAALYRLETTGLLDMEGAVRTRVNPSLESRADGGSGRNFAVQRYLGPGDYQLSVRSRGLSRGRFGVELQRTPVTDGGELRFGVVSRTWLDAGEAVGYRFRVDEPGTYRVRSLGLSGAFRVRLEDVDGWPLLEPGVKGQLKVALERGEYRLIVLPQEVRARQIALVQRLTDGGQRVGHGPFWLDFGARATHRWLEPEDGGERVPDAWRFHLPAGADVDVEISEAMVGELVRLGAADSGTADQTVAEVEGGASTHALGAGQYELRLRSARRDNRVDYAVEVASRQLLAGQRRAVHLKPGEPPVRLELRVEDPALVELRSFGQLDVRARLFDAVGATAGAAPLAAADDRPGDWNFRLARRLDPGVYHLEVEPVTGGGWTWVHMNVPRESTLEPLALATEARAVDVEPGDGAVRVPLRMPAEADLVTATFDSPENIRVTLELDGRPVAAREGRRGALWLPVATGRDLVLRVDSLDQSGNVAKLELAATTARRGGEGRLSVKASPALGDRGVVAVDLERPGCFRVTGAAGDVESAPAVGVGPSPLAGVASSVSGVLYLAAPSGSTFGLERFSVRAGAGPTRLRIPAGGEAVCDVDADGPALVEARGLGAPVSLSFGAEFGDQGLADTSALLLPTAPGALRLRSGDGAELEVDIEARAVPPGAGAAFGWGRSESAVEAGRALDLQLPPGPKRLRLSLSRGLAAELADGRTVWARSSGLDMVLATGGSTLRVVDVAGSGGRVAVDAAQAKPTRPLGQGTPLERRVAGGVRVEAEVAPGVAGQRLRTSGAEATWLGADGRIRRGADLPISDVGGRLRLETADDAGDAALAVAWTEAAGRSPFAVSGEAREVEVPSQTALDGATAAFTVRTAEPSVLTVRAPSPAVATVERPGGDRDLSIHPQSLRLDVALPAGESRLELRSLAGERLRGELDLRRSPIERLAEGLGDPILLGGGETRFFAVELTEPGDLGFGVNADADVVEARLYDDAGRVVGAGVAQMHRLHTGRYLLALSLPIGQAPVAVSPAVVGLEKPGSGPPPDLVQNYLRLAAEATPGAAP